MEVRDVTHDSRVQLIELRLYGPGGSRPGLAAPARIVGIGEIRAADQMRELECAGAGAEDSLGGMIFGHL
jgi:hypothetical protein